MLPSLGPGSAVGEKGNKRGQIGEILASEASPVVAWGGGKGGRALRQPFPSPEYLSTSLFPPMRSLVPGYSIPSPWGDDNGQAGSRTVLCIAIEVGLVLNVCTSFCLVPFALPGSSNISQFLPCRYQDFLTPC